MKKSLIFALLAVVFLGGIAFFLFAGKRFLNTETGPEILGLRVGMKMNEAHQRLEGQGTKQKDESKMQEVWLLNDNKNYSYVIVGFNKEDEKIRFINAKARESGDRVRYADVIDLGKAVQQGSANNNKYVLEFPSEGFFTPGYRIIARGTNNEFLSYYAAEQLYTNSEEEEEDDE